MLLQGCTDERKVEAALTTAAAQSQRQPVILDTVSLFKEKTKKICIQDTYMTEKAFSEISGEQISDFITINEGQYVVWFFFEASRMPVTAKINKKDVALNEKQRPCTESTVLYFSYGTMEFN